MGNCLKTQLKENVNNDNLKFLDKVVLDITFGENYPVEGLNLCAIYTVNHTVPSVSVIGDAVVSLSDSGYNSYILNIIKGNDANVKVIINNKYDVTGINLYGDVLPYSFNVDALADFYNLTHLSSGTAQTGLTTEMIQNYKNIQFLDSSNLSISGSLDHIAKCSSLETLDFQYCSAINGDLSAIKDLPNLTTVILNNTYVTDNDNTVSYLESRGVTVTYVPYE